MIYLMLLFYVLNSLCYQILCLGLTSPSPLSHKTYKSGKCSLWLGCELSKTQTCWYPNPQVPFAFSAWFERVHSSSSCLWKDSEVLKAYPEPDTPGSTHFLCRSFIWAVSSPPILGGESDTSQCCADSGDLARGKLVTCFGRVGLLFPRVTIKHPLSLSSSSFTLKPQSILVIGTFQSTTLYLTLVCTP